VALTITKYLAPALESLGLATKTTRYPNVFIELGQRCAIADDWSWVSFSLTHAPPGVRTDRLPIRPRWPVSFHGRIAQNRAAFAESTTPLYAVRSSRKLVAHSSATRCALRVDPSRYVIAV
jgi:hypothetical protein